MSACNRGSSADGRDAHIARHDCFGSPGSQHFAGEDRCACFAFGASDADRRCGTGSEENGHLHFDRHPGVPGREQERIPAPNGRIAYDQIGVGEIRLIVTTENETNGKIRKLCDLVGQIRFVAKIGDGDDCPRGGQIPGDTGTASARAESHYGRALAVPAILIDRHQSNARATPIRPHIMPTIQNRIVIWVSDQPITSKWWWSGVILKIRLPPESLK